MNYKNLSERWRLLIGKEGKLVKKYRQISGKI
jgi:hypothetical protein